MRVLHTADWHIGQTLNGWLRDAEHQVYFERLRDIVANEQIDVMLVAGDVYDGINPSGAAQRILYEALKSFKRARPGLKIVMTSGNHDPAGRLEAPRAILEELDVHVIAHVRRSGGEINAEEHMIPLPGKKGSPAAWVCAIPFLRAADLPGLSFSEEEGRGSPIVEAARRFHLAIARGAREIADDLPILAMGHLHCHGATEASHDEGSAERRILIGGAHALPCDVFPEAFDYVALGHLHRPQDLDGGRIRYSGSCFPLSAAELTYDHGVTILDIEDGKISKKHVSIERPVQFHRLPGDGSTGIAGLEDALDQLELSASIDPELRPFAYVNLTADGPAAVTLTEAEKLLTAYPLRLAGLRVRRDRDEVEDMAPASLSETDPEDLFRTAFKRSNGMEPEDRHVAAFREAMVGE